MNESKTETTYDLSTEHSSKCKLTSGQCSYIIYVGNIMASDTLYHIYLLKHQMGIDS